MFTPSTRTRPVTGVLTIALYSVRPRRDASGCGLPTCTETMRPTPGRLLRAPADALGLAGVDRAALVVDDELHAIGAGPVAAVQLHVHRRRDPRRLPLALALHVLDAGVLQGRGVHRVERRQVHGAAGHERRVRALGLVEDPDLRGHAVRPGHHRGGAALAGLAPEGF